MTAMRPAPSPWARLKDWATASIRRQIALGIALVHAVLMTMLVVDVATKQTDFLTRQGIERAEALARIVAVNSGSWVAAGDVRGLQEVIAAITQHDDVMYAMVVDRRGAVLAHTDGDRVGSYLADPVSLRMLATTLPEVLRLVETDDMVDIAVPVAIGDRMRGWARIAMDQSASRQAMRVVVRDGIAYTLGAIVIGTLFALWIAARLTRRLQGLTEASERLRRGEVGCLPVADGTDEIAHLAVTFRGMASTIETREGELRNTIDKLGTSNAELERFAYVASHDLQEPLRTIVSYGQLIERRYKGRLDADADEFIAFMIDASMRLHHMVQALLEVSRAGANGRPLEPLDLHEVIATAMDNLQQAIAESHAQISVGQMPQVWGDRPQLVQVFQNLIANAVKFRHPGAAPVVSIKASADDVMATLTVTDNGIGVADENVEEVFTIFRRLHKAGEFPGSGVGLAVCRRIVERHGGRIHCVPRPEGGTSFVFTLPLNPPQA